MKFQWVEVFCSASHLHTAGYSQFYLVLNKISIPTHRVVDWWSWSTNKTRQIPLEKMFMEQFPRSTHLHVAISPRYCGVVAARWPRQTLREPRLPFPWTIVSTPLPEILHSYAQSCRLMQWKFTNKTRQIPLEKMFMEQFPRSTHLHVAVSPRYCGVVAARWPRQTLRERNDSSCTVSTCMKNRFFRSNPCTRQMTGNADSDANNAT